MSTIKKLRALIAELQERNDSLSSQLLSAEQHAHSQAGATRDVIAEHRRTKEKLVTARETIKHLGAIIANID